MQQLQRVITLSATLAALLLSSLATAHSEEQQLTEIIYAIELGWENGDPTPFRDHYLDFEGARYIESGGQNKGLADLIDHHVVPEGESLSSLDLEFSNIETHVENDFAWALADVEVKASLRDESREIHKRGYETFLFRRVGNEWKVVHTHSSTRAVKDENPPAEEQGEHSH